MWWPKTSYHKLTTKATKIETVYAMDISPICFRNYFNQCLPIYVYLYSSFDCDSEFKLTLLLAIHIYFTLIYLATLLFFLCWFGLVDLREMADSNIWMTHYSSVGIFGVQYRNFSIFVIEFIFPYLFLQKNIKSIT